MTPIDRNGLERSHYKGAASELIAASHYLSRGHQVYWPAVQQSYIDFIVDLNGELKKVQVKTTSWNGDHLQCHTTSTNKYHLKASEKYDILFIVSDVGMWEIPADLINSSSLGLANRTGDYRPRGIDWSRYRIGTDR